jgi:cytosine deaminase
MAHLTLTNARRNGGPTLEDIAIEDGRISAIGPAGTLPKEGPVEDVGGQIVLPGFVDGHCHADKSLWGEPWAVRSSQVISMEQMFEDTLKQWATPTTPVAKRAGAFMHECVRHGSTFIRTFADVDPAIGLDGVHGVFEAREQLRGLADIRVIAFPQLGILRRPGNEELLEEALREGADGVGGLDPAAVEGAAERQLDIVFGLARKYQVSVDFHMHEEGELGLWLIRRIAERTKALGMQGRVSICDVFSIAHLNPDDTARISAVLADAGITVAVGVHGLLPVPDVETMSRCGVHMCLGSDSSRSLWSPWGDGDMLARSSLLAYKKYFRRDVDLELALDLANVYGQVGMGLPKNHMDIGDPADLVVLPGEAKAELVVLPPPRTLVIKDGRVTVRDGKVVTG